MSNDNLLDILSQMPKIPTFDPPMITKIGKIDSPAFHRFVDSQFQILKRYIQDFESTLDPQHEVGIMMTNFGQSIIMQVEEITYEEPITLIFKGQVNGKNAILIQHMNQLNFLLTSLDKVDERPKNPIGFRVPSE